MSKISTREYKKILKYYGLPIPSSARRIKTLAEKILTKKYCSCIQKVKKEGGNKKTAISVCTDSVIHKKGLQRGAYTCKKKQRLSLRSNRRTRRK